MLLGNGWGLFSHAVSSFLPSIITSRHWHLRDKGSWPPQTGLPSPWPQHKHFSLIWSQDPFHHIFTCPWMFSFLHFFSIFLHCRVSIRLRYLQSVGFSEEIQHKAEDGIPGICNPTCKLWCRVAAWGQQSFSTLAVPKCTSQTLNRASKLSFSTLLPNQNSKAS